MKIREKKRTVLPKVKFVVHEDCSRVTRGAQKKRVRWRNPNVGTSSHMRHSFALAWPIVTPRSHMPFEPSPPNRDEKMAMEWEKGQRKALLQRKGVFPYDFAKRGHEQLEATQHLPEREDFFNVLTQKHVSEEDYAHAKVVFDTFGCRNMLDYSSVYVQSDVFLLAEVVETTRRMVWENFGLDMLGYFSLPMLSKQVMLKSTGVKMEQIADPEMIFTLRRGIRGGLSFINRRMAELEKEEDDESSSSMYGDEEPRTKLVQYREISSRHAPLEADPHAEKQDMSILYCDANNLYGKAMSMVMPQSGFRWLDQEEIDALDLNEDITEDDGPGYIFEVDLGEQ